MAALHRELVVSRGWLTPERYALIYSLARATPGTNLLAFCAGIGWQLARWTGALVAVLSASIPCAAAVVWFTYVYSLWRSNPLAMSAIYAAVYIPSLAAALMWALILFLGEIVSTFIAWGISAGIRHGTHNLYRKLTGRFS